MTARKQRRLCCALRPVPRSASHHRRPDRFLYGLVLYSNRAMAAQYNLCFYSIPRFLEKVHTFFHAPLFRTNFLSESLLRPCAPVCYNIVSIRICSAFVLPMKQGGCLMSKKVNKLTEPNMRLYRSEEHTSELQSH